MRRTHAPAVTACAVAGGRLARDARAVEASRNVRDADSPPRAVVSNSSVDAAARCSRAEPTRSARAGMMRSMTNRRTNGSVF
jgi:hypothetical protein